MVWSRTDEAMHKIYRLLLEALDSLTANKMRSMLTIDDANQLAGLSNVDVVAPQTESFVQVVYQGQNTNTRLMGVTSGYQDLGSMTLADGEFLSDTDQANRDTVVVLGSSVAETLFGSTRGGAGARVRLNGPL